MGISGWQLILILVIVFVLFGAGKLPKVMGEIGRGMRNMKDGLKGDGESVAEDEKIATSLPASPVKKDTISKTKTVAKKPVAKKTVVKKAAKKTSSSKTPAPAVASKKKADVVKKAVSKNTKKPANKKS
jgi:sec-independent protein translocase protein TatA